MHRLLFLRAAADKACCRTLIVESPNGAPVSLFQPAVINSSIQVQNAGPCLLLDGTHDVKLQQSAVMMLMPDAPTGALLLLICLVCVQIDLGGQLIFAGHQLGLESPDANGLPLSAAAPLRNLDFRSVDNMQLQDLLGGLLPGYVTFSDPALLVAGPPQGAQQYTSTIMYLDMVWPFTETIWQLQHPDSCQHVPLCAKIIEVQALVFNTCPAIWLQDAETLSTPIGVRALLCSCSGLAKPNTWSLGVCACSDTTSGYFNLFLPAGQSQAGCRGRAAACLQCSAGLSNNCCAEGQHIQGVYQGPPAGAAMYSCILSVTAAVSPACHMQANSRRDCMHVCRSTSSTPLSPACSRLQPLLLHLHHFRLQPQWLPQLQQLLSSLQC